MKSFPLFKNIEQDKPKHVRPVLTVHFGKTDLNPKIVERIESISSKVSPSDQDHQSQFDDLDLFVPAGVFDPAKGKSARKMQKAIALVPPKASEDVLELGTGTGVLSILMSKLGVKKITASDINTSAVQAAEENFKNHNVAAKAVQSDLFEKINGKYDYVIFNAPTAHSSISDPNHKGATALWDISKTLKNRFFNDVKKHLKGVESKILLMYSKYTDYDSLKGIDLSDYDKSYLMVDNDEISESGVLLLSPKKTARSENIPS